MSSEADCARLLGRASPQTATTISSSGRFTQEDPIGLAGGLNLYSFAGGDPVSYGDPYGLCKIDVQFTPAGGIGKHAAIIVTESNGAAMAFDGGPEHGTSSGGNGVGAIGGASGMASEGSGSDSPRMNSSSPGAGQTGSTNALYGRLQTKPTPYVPGQPIYQPNAPRKNVLNNDEPCDKYKRSFESSMETINNANIVYNPFTTNSNAAASYMLKQAGLRLGSFPERAIVPGWNRNLFGRPQVVLPRNLGIGLGIH